MSILWLRWSCVTSLVVWLTLFYKPMHVHHLCNHRASFQGLVQDCSISNANALEILQSCAKPLICYNLCSGHQLAPGRWWVSTLRPQQNDIFNSSSPGQNGCHFADDIFRYIFVNEKFCILIKISLKFVPEGPVDNYSALIWIMARCWIGEKPLSEPMWVRFTDV